MTPGELRFLGSRLDLGPFLTQRGYVGAGVEIGTYRGEYAREILSKWPGHLTCVDPWEDFDRSEYLDGCNAGDMDIVYQEAVLRLAAWSDRVSFTLMRSADAVGQFADDSLDFVYIDGNHREDVVRRDIAGYWPKVQLGGILAGHDLYDRDDDAQKCGVWSAVWDFAHEINQKPHVTHCSSWWLIKTEL